MRALVVMRRYIAANLIEYDEDTEDVEEQEESMKQ
jgi:hypothetical protein